VLAAAFLWGTTGTAQAFGPPGASPATVGALRLLIGGLVLLAIAFYWNSFSSRKPWIWSSTLLSATCLAAYQICFFAAVRISGVAIGTMVAIGSAPILAGILVWVFQQERPGWRWMTATILAIGGCVVLIGSTDPTGTLKLTGLLLALGAGTAYAGYTFSTKRLLRDQAPTAVVAVVFSLGALILLPVLFFSDLSWLAERNGIVIVLHLGLIATALAYLFFARGLRQVPVPTAVTLSLAEPLTAAFLGILILKEPVAWYSRIGMALLFSGLAILTINRSQPDARSKQAMG
jgi:DME family drug/metabolite transporter